MFRQVRRSATLLALLALALTACAQAGAPTASPTVSTSASSVPFGLQGFYMPQPQVKPEFTLTDTSGRPFDFQRETAGTVTLLYFGYTHCPDICPAHMAIIAAALDQLPSTVTGHVRVVFVTTDPERDRPRILRDWLDTFDPNFVGLTGTPDQLVAAQIAANVPVAQREGQGEDYGVSHAAQVIAYTPDGLAHVVYPFGMRQSNWVNDLPILVKVGSPGGPWSADERGLVVSGAVMPTPARKDLGAVYLTVENTGRTDDALIGATAPTIGATVELHVTEQQGGTATMRQVDELPVPAGGELKLEPGGAHLMVMGLPEQLKPGDPLVLELRFREAGAIPVVVSVVPYTELPEPGGMGDMEHGSMDHGDMGGMGDMGGTR
jgi:cytochrome oxidase Cu insertion factor (SCO1/SenC/PrrC family)/copper(I)-binding protein